MRIADRTIVILGGTGPQGRGLARRFAEAGIEVVLGSRDATRAGKTAMALGEVTGGAVRGAANAEAGDVVLVVVPWAGHGELLRELKTSLAGKNVGDCVYPLGFDKQGAYAL